MNPAAGDRRSFPPTLRRAGFVLAGGRSTRMGRDKALLRLGGTTLVERIARQVLQAAGSVTLLGPPERYAGLGFPVVADLLEDRGPLGGLYTALQRREADWNLLVACDLPHVTAPLLTELLDAAERSGKAALVPSTERGLEPLCAVYHRRLLPEVTRALEHNVLKMHDFVSSIGAAVWPAPDRSVFDNVNTPSDWEVLR